MKKACPICHGSGQLSSFKGVSRFLLSWEECPVCSGLGYLIPHDAGNGPPTDNKVNNDIGKAKRKKR